MNNAALTANTNEKVNLVKNIANKTRGPYTPEKYGNVIIPMAIIRRFDCILAKKNKEISVSSVDFVCKNISRRLAQILLRMGRGEAPRLSAYSAASA